MRLSGSVEATVDGGFPPGEQGLERKEALPVWSFPEKYIEKISFLLVEELKNFEPR